MDNSVVNDLVGRQAFDQLERLMKDLQKSIGLVEEFNQKVGSAQGAMKSAKGFEELAEAEKKAQTSLAEYSKAYDSYANSQKKVTEKQNEIIEAQKKAAAALSQAGKSITELRSQIDAYNSTITRNNALIKEETERYNQGKTSKAEYIRLMKQVKAENDSMQASVRLLNSDLKQAAKVESDIAGIYTKKSATLERLRKLYRDVALSQGINSKSAKELRGSITSLDKELKRVDASMGVFSRSVGGYGTAIIGSFKKIAAAAGVTLGLTALFNVLKSGIATIRDFEKQNAVLASVFGKTRKEIVPLTKNAKDLGATTEYTASQITGLQVELARLGTSEGDIVKMTKPISQFATAVGADLSSAAALAGSTLKAFGLEASETERVVGVMALGTTKSALSFSYLDTAMSIVSPVAKAFGFTIEDTVALLGTLADAGFDASSAATATRNILLNLADSNGKLAQTLGKPVKNINDLTTGLKELRDRGINLNETLELTDKRSVAAFNSFLDGTESTQKLRNELESTSGVLDKMQKEQLDTMDGSIKLLESAWEGLMLQLSSGSGIVRGFVDLLSWLVTGLNDTAAATADLGRTIGRFFAGVGTSNATAIADEQRDNSIKIVNQTFESHLKALRSLKENASKTDEEVQQLAVDSFVVMLENQLNNLKVFQRKAIGDFEKMEKYYRTLSYPEQLTVKSILDEKWGDLDKFQASRRLLEENIALIKSYKKEVESTPSGTDNGDTAKSKETDRERLKHIEKERKEREQILKLMRDASKIEEDSFTSSRKAVADDPENDYGKRMAALQNYGALRNEEIDRQLDYELKAINASGDGEELKLARVRFAQVKANAARVKLEQDVAKSIEKITSDSVEKRINAEKDRLKELEQQELLEASGMYAKGLINEEEYNKKKNDIQQKYAMAMFDFELNLLEQELLAIADTEEEKEKIREKYRQLRKKKDAEATDNEIKQNEKAGASAKDWYSDEKDAWLTAASEIAGFSAAMGDVIFENRKNSLDKEIQKVEEEKEKEIEAINASADTEEEKQRRIEVAEAQAAAKSEALENRKAQLARRQAIFNKAMSAAQTQINTAQAIMKVWADYAGPIAVAMTIAIAAAGAAQLATIIGTPIPAYEKGTDYHQGGEAMVGEKRRELLITPDGKLFLTADKPQVLDLPKGTQVLPDAAVAMQQLALNASVVPKYQSASIDISRIEKGLLEVKNAVVSSKATQYMNFDRNGIITVSEDGRGKVTYVNQKI